MRYKNISVLLVFLLMLGQVEPAFGQEDSPEITGDCRAVLELKSGQGCSVPDKGFFSIRSDGCVGATPSISGAFSISEISFGNGRSTCVKGDWSKGEFVASEFSSDPLTRRINSVPPWQAD